MRILVLGGDGYLGWPTALHLSACGHEVAVADNFVRRQYDHELGVRSLVPIEPLAARVDAWREVSGRRLDVFVGDLCDAEFTYDISVKHVQVTTDLMQKLGVGRMEKPPSARDWVKTGLLEKAKKSLGAK